METINNWLSVWQQYKYHSEISFFIFIPLFFLLRSIIIKQLHKHVQRFDDSDIYPFIVSLINWGTFYAIIFYAVVYFKETFWLSEAWFKVGENEVTTLTFIIPATIISLAFKFARFFSRFVLVRVYQRYEIEEGTQYTFTRLLHYVIIVVAFLIALPTVGFDLSSLTVFAGVVGVGIGFGMQNIASNFISGIIILFERPIKVGDRITLDGLQCDVEHITIRSTIVRTRNNEHIIIPNSQFVENQVVNWSYGDPLLRVELFIGVAYGSNVPLVQKLLLQAADEHKNILKEKAPRVDFLEFGDSSLNFRLLFWIPDPALRTRVISALNYRINELFEQNNVEIPFPQRDLHVRSVDGSLLKQVQIEYEKQLSSENQ
ncbi:MAG: mechanosensitive ion channel [Firmicutes bacterium]|nr:mechanosensitive ion channel [Bacillota bacterium]